MDKYIISSRSLTQLIYFSNALITTFFLLWLDEGQYNFEWLSSYGNWLALLIYTSVLYFGQIAFSKTLSFMTKRSLKIVFSSVLGTSVGFALSLIISITIL